MSVIDTASTHAGSVAEEAAELAASVADRSADLAVGATEWVAARRRNRLVLALVAAALVAIFATRAARSSDEDSSV